MIFRQCYNSVLVAVMCDTLYCFPQRAQRRLAMPRKWPRAIFVPWGSGSTRPRGVAISRKKGTVSIRQRIGRSPIKMSSIFKFFFFSPMKFIAPSSQAFFITLRLNHSLLQQYSVHMMCVHLHWCMYPPTHSQTALHTLCVIPFLYIGILIWHCFSFQVLSNVFVSIHNIPILKTHSGIAGNNTHT